VRYWVANTDHAWYAYLASIAPIDEGRQLRAPQKGFAAPSKETLDWHSQTLFRG
jgi:hypothetical protein